MNRVKPSADLLIYSVDKNDPAGAVERHHMAALAALRQQPGFLSAHTFRSVEDKHQFVDYVLWSDPDSHRKATAGLRSVAAQEGNGLTSIQFAGRFELDRMPADSAFTPDGLLQLAVVKLDGNSLDRAESSRSKLLNCIDHELDLCMSLHSGRSIDDPALFFDALKWPSMEDQKEGSERIHQMDACPAFMSTIEEDLYFQSLSKYA